MSENGKPETVAVEVAYAMPFRQAIVSVRISPGTTVEEAIRVSGILKTFPEIDLSVTAVGIFGERVRLQDPVNAGDRIEIYRPLIADPRQSRKRRAAKAGKRKR